MANKKISQLTPKGSALAGTDLLEVSVFNGATYDTKSLTGANVVSGLQPTLFSGTNIKTINSTSLLGSGDIAISTGLTVGTTPITSGTVGRVLFQGTGNVVQEDSALFWDNTNKRLGVGATPATAVRLDVRAQGALSTDIAFRVRNSANSADIIRANGLGDVYIGIDAGRVNTATQNTFVGYSSGYSNTSGQSNSVLGNQALALNVVGNNNTAIGFASLRQNVNNSNTAIGSESLRYNTSGSANTAIGVESLITNTIGIQNTATGASSLYSNTSGNNNVGDGYGALVFNSTGSNNIAVGHNSGKFIADGVTSNAISNNSVFLGQATKALANNQTNQIVIGYDATGLGSNTSVIGNSSTTLFKLYGAGMFENIASPSGVADNFHLYSADITAGNAAPHFRTENGAVVKIYQETTAVATATVVSGAGGTVKHDDTFDGYTLQQIVKALRNTGLLA